MDWSDLLNLIVETIEQPTADPRRTLLLAASGLVTFLILAVLIFILLPSEKQREPADWTLPEPAPPEAPKSPKLLLGISLLLALLALAGLGYGDSRSRQEAACRSCHVLGDVVSTWEQGSHPDIGCVECHSSSGVLGIIETRVRAASNAFNNLGGNVTLSAAVAINQENCRSCHAKTLSSVLTKGSLRVRHADFAESLSCGQCHPQVGHETVVDGARNRAIMPYCASCHDGSTASRQCETCHLDDVAYIGGDAGQYPSVQLSAPKTCDGCHSLEGCTECHGIEMPHPEGFGDPKVHARLGAFDDVLCDRCHDEGCSPCHNRIHTDHVPDWKTKHQTADSQLCVQCHDAGKVGTNMCRLCHPSNPRGSG